MQEGPQVQSKGASMESVEHRMLMHVGSVGVSKYACAMADPLRLRGLVEARMLNKQHNTVQACLLVPVPQTRTQPFPPASPPPALPHVLTIQ